MMPLADIIAYFTRVWLWCIISERDLDLLIECGISSVEFLLFIIFVLYRLCGGFKDSCGLHNSTTLASVSEDGLCRTSRPKKAANFTRYGAVKWQINLWKKKKWNFFHYMNLVFTVEQFGSECRILWFIL